MRYRKNRGPENRKQGPARLVTLRRVKMPEQNKYSLKVFVRDIEGKRIFCGQYETEVDNYVLSVDVFGRPLLVQSVEIEFLGKVQEAGKNE